MEKSWSRQQLEAAQKASPRRRRNKPSGEFRDIPAGSEDEIQAQFFKWVDAVENQFPEVGLFHAIPNGNNLTKFGRYVGSITGRKSGVPDTHLPLPGMYDKEKRMVHSLWIEFKTPSGTVSKEQWDWITKLRLSGNRVEICRSWFEAANIVIEHLRLPLAKL